MTVFTNDEMIRLHHLIRSRCTGTPKELAKRLSCSKRKVHYLLEKMRDEGIPIEWNEHRQTYYYTEEVNLQFSLTIGQKVLRSIRGGNSSQQNIFEKNCRVQPVCTHDD